MPRTPDRICADLERHGVTPEVSRSLSRRLAGMTETLDADAYAAMISAVSVACGTSNGAVADRVLRTAQELEEIQHLLGSFTDELRKLDEALETLAAYVIRLKAQTTKSKATLH